MKIKETYDIGMNYKVGWKTKEWPKKRWSRLERELRKDYSISWQQGLDNIDDYIKWIGSCKTIITIESLGLHLASALRKKVIALCGPITDNEYSYDRITFLRPEERTCMPCDSPTCIFGDSCLKDIKVEDVIREL